MSRVLLESLLALWHGMRSRASPCLLLIVMAAAIVNCVVYICYLRSLKTLPTSPDLCQILRVNPLIDSMANRTRAWWEWACLIERELDKGEEYHCNDQRTKGNYPLCYDPAYRPQPPCLVYSFGIDYDFSFDDAMAADGCEVFSFDPSMKLKDHEHAHRVIFKALGLSSRDSDNYQPKLDGYVTQISQWKVRTLGSIRKMLGHEKRTIDILKIDVESYEWAAVREMLDSRQLSSVRQLHIEWHIFPNEPFRTHFPAMYQTLMELKRLGFRQFYVNSFSRFHHVDYFNSQADTSLVNTKFVEPAAMMGL